MAALGRTVTGGEYTFNLRCGALARLSNGARTVERRRPLSEFNNAVTMSSIPLIDGVPFEVRIEGKVSTWSGSLLLGERCRGGAHYGLERPSACSYG